MSAPLVEPTNALRSVGVRPTGESTTIGSPETRSVRKSKGCHRSAILVKTRIPPRLLAWRDGGFAAFRVLVPRASSIPPSKEDDEAKNREYEEQAEQPGRLRAHARSGGGHAALL